MGNALGRARNGFDFPPGHCDAGGVPGNPETNGSTTT